MRTSPAARAIIAAFALVLLIPVFGVRRQPEFELQQFHNRTLRAWPAGSTFVANPTAYFNAAKGWISDRVFPIIGASALLKRVLFYALHTPPQRRVSLADDGFIFLNGSGEDSVNGILQQSCVSAHTGPLAEAVATSLKRFARYGRAHGLQMDVVVVPTLATVYGDRLPDSIPEPLRHACQARTQGDSPLQRVTAPDGVHFVYPLQPMVAARGDPAFYPRANWHPVGLSLKTIRNAYLATLGASSDIPETLTPTLAPSELMATYGIDVPTPVYALRNAAVTRNPTQSAEWNASIVDLFEGAMVNSRFFVNSRATSAESVLMLSDSYGDAASEVFAGAFASLLQITTNNVSAANLTKVVDRLDRIHKFDRVIFLVQEGNTPRVVAWSEVFDAPTQNQAAVE